MFSDLLSTVLDPQQWAAMNALSTAGLASMLFYFLSKYVDINTGMSRYEYMLALTTRGMTALCIVTLCGNFTDSVERILYWHEGMPPAGEVLFNLTLALSMFVTLVYGYVASRAQPEEPAI